MVCSGKLRTANFFIGSKIGGNRLRSFALVVLFAGCQQNNEFSNLELRDIVFAYQNKGLFQKQDKEWHPFKHGGAERGVSLP